MLIVQVMLFGASDGYSGDAIMQITITFNHFGQGLTQRMPRCRWGFFHVVNNDYTHWLMYAIGGSHHPTILSQGNRFIAPPDINCKEVSTSMQTEVTWNTWRSCSDCSQCSMLGVVQVTKRDYSPESVWKSWTWRSQGDLMMNGAFFVESGDPNFDFSNKYVIRAKPGAFVTRLTRFSGALSCREGMPC